MASNGVAGQLPNGDRLSCQFSFKHSDVLADYHTNYLKHICHLSDFYLRDKIIPFYFNLTQVQILSTDKQANKQVGLSRATLESQVKFSLLVLLDSKYTKEMG